MKSSQKSFFWPRHVLLAFVTFLFPSFFYFVFCLYIYALINNDYVRAIKLEQGRQGSIFGSLGDGIPCPKIAQFFEVLGTEEYDILSTKNGVYISEDLPRLPY